MRIIKESGVNTCRVIAGEMLNIETSLQYFRDGQKIPAAERDLNNYKGYPKVVNGTIEYVFKAAVGYIYLPLYIDIAEFEKQLLNQLAILIKIMEYDGITVLNDYHTFTFSQTTNLKIASAQRITSPHEEHLTNKPTNIVRKFSVNDDLKARTSQVRFTWIMAYINTFNDTNDVDNVLTSQVCSIFYDKYDVCTLAHNDVTYMFSSKLLRAYDNITNETLIFFKHGHLLLFELSKFWADNYISIKSADFMRNIDESKLYHSSHEIVSIKPNDVCHACKSILWGDNYVLIKSLKTMQYIILCPICLHTSNHEDPPESNCEVILRCPAARKDIDMLEMLDITDVKKDIINEILAGTTEKCIEIGQCTITYVLVGKKYITTDIDSYLYYSLIHDPDIVDRKFFSVKTIT